MSAPSTAPVLVLVHAFPMGAAMWRPQLQAAPGWGLITPSLPGFDGREVTPSPTIDDYARDVLQTLDARGVERAVFGGLSLGGYVIFAILRLAPERVAGLFLADTRSSDDDEARIAARHRSIDMVRRHGQSATADEMLPNILGKTTHARRPEVVAQVRSLIESQPVETIVGALQAMMSRPDSAGTLAKVTVPTTIVVGEEDTVTPLSDAEFMHRTVRGSSLVTIPSAGHMANLETPDAFNAALRTFLAGLRQ